MPKIPGERFSDSQRKSPMRCFSCNGVGHRAFECPGSGGGGGGGGFRNGGGRYGGGGGGRGSGCYNCGEEGHQSRDCSKPRQERSRGCYNCGEEGHRAADCPTGGSGGGRDSYSHASCFKCGQVGHMSWNCDVSDGRAKTCFKCKEPGHLAANCPNDAGQSDICYKCGSTEHKLSQCPKFDGNNLEDLPYAKCYVCQKEGHMARNCTQNKNGAYPKGGACHGCGQSGHFVRDCPQANKNDEADDSLLGDNFDSSSTSQTTDLQAKKPKKDKVVTF